MRHLTEDADPAQGSAPTREDSSVSRREQLALRSIGLGVLAGVAVVLSGCVTTVDGRAVAGSTIGPLATTTSTPSSPSSPPGSSTTRTSPPGSDPTEVTDADDEPDEVTDAGAYTGLALGEPVWVTWGDDEETGDADIIVRSARFEDTPDGLRFLVTVDYECYVGECYYDVDDWTVRGADGRQHRPEYESHFGDDSADIYDTLAADAQKRGHLVFDVPTDVSSVEYDARSGDPATWLVPTP